MLDDNPEALVWIVALESALARLARAESRVERLRALEAIEEARESLSELLDTTRELALAVELPESLDLN